MGACNCKSSDEAKNEIKIDGKREEKLKNNRIKNSLIKNDTEIDEKENEIQFTGIENGMEIKETNIMVEKNNQSEKNYNPNKFVKRRPKIYLYGNSTNRTNETIFQFDTNRNIPFPEGEHRFQIVKDFNQIKIEEKKDNLSERVELFFSLNNIEEPKNNYSFGISIINNKRTGIQTFLGEIEGTGESIQFGDSFEVDYFFERVQIIIIEPKINGNETGEKKEFILSNLMTNRKGKINIDIENVGTLEIKQQKTKRDKELNTEISCFQFFLILKNDIFKNPNNLKNMFYVIRNIKDGEKKRPVYKSHEYDFELNRENITSWISLDSDLLCNSNDMEIFFELYSPSIKINEYIGDASFNLNKLKSNLSQDKIETIEIKNQEFGKIGILKIFYNQKKKLGIDKFVKNGQINLEIAIDYTKSNESENAISLHYRNGETPNDYEKAIKSCVNIIANYDSDNLFPVYGFGGIPEGKNEVSHCFNINFNEDDANILGLDNIIKFYKDSLDKVKLWGPTHFEPVIKKVISNIKYDLENRRSENHYYILMILTDGIINDMNETIDSIVEGSKLPLSIIIIGVGNANFTNMEILDGDKIPLMNSFGEIRKRDIVQFVEFNKYQNEKGVNDGDELAEEVLKEIPRQIEEYYQFCGKFYE